MDHTRRRILALLPLPGIALAASKLVPAETAAHELDPNRRYLLHVRSNICPEDAYGIEQGFQSRGLDVTVLAGTEEIDLFDLGPKAASRAASIRMKSDHP